MGIRGILSTLVLLAALLCFQSPPPAAAQGDDHPTARELLQQAEYRFRLGEYEDARSIYQEILFRYPGTIWVDKAVVGIARSHLAEGDYAAGIRYLEDVLSKSNDLESRVEAHRLYIRLESRIRRLRTSAYEAYVAKQQEYDSISWFNIFKIFKKLRLKSELARARHDYEEISRLHDLFNPSLLVPPISYGGTDEEETAGEETASEEATGSTTTTGEVDREGESRRERLRSILEKLRDEIAALVDELEERILSRSGEEESSCPTEETTSSESGAAISTATTAPETKEEENVESESPAMPESSSAPILVMTTSVDEEEVSTSAAVPTTGATAEEEAGGTSAEETALSTEPLTQSTEEVAAVIGEDETPSSTEPAEISTDATAATTATTGDASVAAAPEPSDGEGEEAPPATIGELRAEYIQAYRRYREALSTLDREAVMRARYEFQEARRRYVEARRRMMEGGAASATSGAEEVSGGGAPAAPAASAGGASPAAADGRTGRGITVTPRVVPTTSHLDRGGIIRPGSAINTVSGARRSLHRK